ncbi:MAG: DUF3737 family protein [Propionibacteriaceae bacterium]|jgi:hypothetical protein|nr:DUF3737 family protein [Propionibacteriaceae bacterium]
MAPQDIVNQRLTGERALFHSQDLAIRDSVFADGESPLKHGADLSLDRVVFQWKYPLWYARNVQARDCTLLETARSGIWYTDNVIFSDSTIAAPKTFRRSRGIKLERVSLPHASETLWNCADIELHHVTASGDYFAMNSQRIVVDGLDLTGNYAFDGGSQIEVRNSRLISKDAFWNCHDVVVRDSTIIGEYLAWNSSNLTFVNCVISSLQGLCYVDQLLMRGCRFIDTTLAFEYSTVDVEYLGSIDSIINPTSGRIVGQGVGQLIMDPDRIDPSRTTILDEGGAVIA